MAALILLKVAPATQEQFHELDALVGQSMGTAGGPPPGLMSHVAYPEGEGYVVADVWRTTEEGRSYVDDVLRPLMDRVGLPGHETTVLPVWSYARP